MANETDIIVRIKAEGSQEFVKQLKNAGVQVEKVGDEVEETERKVKKSSDKMSSSFKAVGGAIAAAFATAQISAFIKESVRLADIQLKAEAQLLKGLKGREDVQKRLIKQAKDLQKVTTFGDEQIIAQQAYLANLEFTEEQIKKIIKASVDLSAGANIPLESSVRNLAKTYSGLSGELGELIPQLRDLTQDQLKNGEGVKVITELYEGQAKVLRETGLGAVESLQNAVGDLREELGKAVLLGLTPLANSLQDISENEDVINFFKGLGTFIGDALKAAGFAVKVVSALGGDLANVLGIGADEAPTIDTIESVSSELERQLELLDAAEKAWQTVTELRPESFAEINAIAGSVDIYRRNVEGLERQLAGLKAIEAEISAEELLQQYLQSLKDAAEDTKDELEELEIVLDSIFFDDDTDALDGLINALFIAQDEALKVGLSLALGISQATPVLEDIPEEVGKTDQQIQDERLAKARRGIDESQRLQQGAFDFFNQIQSARLQVLQNRLDQGLINEKQFEAERSKLLEKQAKADKANAIFSTAINSAAGIVAQFKAGPAGIPLAAVVGALAAAQIAAIIATPIPKFAKGTRQVGDGHELGEDRTLAWLNKGERVVTAKDNKKHFGLYNAIEDNDVEAMIKEMASMGVAVQFNAGKLLADELDRPMKTLKQIKGESKRGGVDLNPLLNASEHSRRSLRGELMKVNRNLELLRGDNRKKTKA